MTEPSARHFCDFRAKRRNGGSNDKRCFVPDTARAVFVNGKSSEKGKVNGIARLRYTLCQTNGFPVAHSSEIYGHRKRRRLIIGNRACRIAVNEEFYFFIGKFFTVSLVVNNVIHSHKKHLRIHR